MSTVAIRHSTAFLLKANTSKTGKSCSSTAGRDSSKKSRFYLAHAVAVGDEGATITGFETDRARFLGIGNTAP
jgi:hypothetical protein